MAPKLWPSRDTRRSPAKAARTASISATTLSKVYSSAVMRSDSPLPRWSHRMTNHSSASAENTRSARRSPSEPCSTSSGGLAASP